MDILKVIISVIIGYILGSIPWALIIGRFFFKKDIRLFGFKDISSTNAIRVFGIRAGFIVVAIDSILTLIVMTICSYIAPNAVQYIGLAMCIGNCFSIFTGFKGGKGVSNAFGYMLGLGIFVTHDIVFAFVYPILIFTIVLGISKYMSLASICFAATTVVIAWLTFNNLVYSLLVTLLAALIVFSHRSNIINLINGEENKISFLA